MFEFYPSVFSLQSASLRLLTTTEKIVTNDYDDDDNTNDDKNVSSTSLILSTGFPSNSITISPGWNPARSAGELGVT